MTGPRRSKSCARASSPQRQRTRQSMRSGNQAGLATKSRMCKTPLRAHNLQQARPHTSPVNTQLTPEGRHRSRQRANVSPAWPGTSRSGRNVTNMSTKLRTASAVSAEIAESAKKKAIQRSTSVSVLASLWQPPRHRIVQTGSKTRSVHLHSSPTDNDYYFRAFDKISYRTQAPTVKQKVSKSGKTTSFKATDAFRQAQVAKRCAPEKFDEHFDKGPVFTRAECGYWEDRNPDNKLASVAKARATAGEHFTHPQRKKFAQPPNGKVKRYNDDAAGARKESGVGKRQHDLLRKQLRFQVPDMAPKGNDDGGEPVWKPQSDYKIYESTITRPAIHTEPTRVKTRGGGIRIMHPDSHTLDGHPFSSTMPYHPHDALTNNGKKHALVAPYRTGYDTATQSMTTVQDATRAMDHTESSQKKLSKRSLKRTKSCPSLRTVPSSGVGNTPKENTSFNQPATESVPVQQRSTSPVRSGFPLHHSESQAVFDRRPATTSGVGKPRESYFTRLFAHSYAQRPKTDYCTRKQYDLNLFHNAHRAHGDRAWHQLESSSAMHEPATQAAQPVVLRSTGNPQHGQCYFHE